MRSAGAMQLDIVNSMSNSDLVNSAFEIIDVPPFADRPGQNGFEGISALREFFGISSSKLSPICCDLVFAHEVGHNLGSSHERLSVNPDQPSSCDTSVAGNGGFTGFSCGHGVLGQWGTIMTGDEPNLPRLGLNLFSNLSNACEGQPCGIAEGQPGQADNQRSFNITREIVSGYRDEVLSEPTGSETIDSGDEILFYLLPVLNKVRERE